MKSIPLALTLLIPDRLPSLIVLVGFWIPPALAGWVAAEFLLRSTRRYRAAVAYAVLAIFVLGYSAAWFFLNLNAIPPNLPGATGSQVRTTRSRFGTRCSSGCTHTAWQRDRLRVGVSHRAEAQAHVCCASVGLTKEHQPRLLRNGQRHMIMGSLCVPLRLGVFA